MEAKECLTNMAMQKPQPRIVGPECNGQVASKRQERHVPSWGVVEVEGFDACAYVIRGCTLS